MGSPLRVRIDRDSRVPGGAYVRRRVTLRRLLFGRSLRSDEDDVERVGVLTAIPVLGLDALASSSYGPEAALTVLLPLGAAATGHVVPLMACVVAILVVVGFSYGQTIAAYPNGGGSFTVAKENLGRMPGLLAAAALCTDYVLNVAVAISAGVGAITSALPGLLPHTLFLCLSILLLLVLVNLRGVRDSGVVFLLPTYLFLGCLLVTIAVGADVAALERPGGSTANGGAASTTSVGSDVADARADVCGHDVVDEPGHAGHAGADAVAPLPPIRVRDRAGSRTRARRGRTPRRGRRAPPP